jgi:hypothetical protein
LQDALRPVVALVRLAYGEQKFKILQLLLGSLSLLTNLKPLVKQPTSATARFKPKVVKILVASKKNKKVRCAELNIDFQWNIWFSV